jgi:hypothetical protein
VVDLGAQASLAMSSLATLLVHGFAPLVDSRVQDCITDEAVRVIATTLVHELPSMPAQTHQELGRDPGGA